MHIVKEMKRQPVICDRCSRLALAVFDEQNLCAHCLIHADKLDLFADGPQPITPLPITTDDFVDSFGLAS